MADNPRTEVLKDMLQQGQPINYRQLFVDAIRNARRAARDTKSSVSSGKFVEAALGQDGNLFASQRLAESGKIVASLGQSPAPSISSPLKQLVTPESVGGTLQTLGYASYTYEMSHATTPSQAMNATTNFTGAIVGGEIGGVLLGGAAAAAGPEAIPVGYSAGVAIGTVIGGSTTKIVETAKGTDWGEVGFVVGMGLLCLL